MSLNWNFKNDFYGIMITRYQFKDETIVNQFNLYDGNALMIACFETENTYQVSNFFADKDHMKNCLGLTKGYDNMYENYEIQLILKPKSKSAKTIAEGFIKAKFKKKLTIIFTEEVEATDSTTPFNI